MTLSIALRRGHETMAVRELFAKFGFEFDKAALQKMEALVKAAEKQVSDLADAANRATSSLGAVSTAQAKAGRSAERAATGARELRQAIIGASAAVKAAAAGDEKASAAMKQLGMSAEKTAASGRSASSVWREMVGRLAKVKNEADRARLAVALLGEEHARAALDQSAGGIGEVRTRRRGAGRSEAAAPPARTVSRWERYRTAVRAGTDAVRQHRKASDELRRNASSGITGGLLQAAFWFGLARGIMGAWQAIGRFAAGATMTLGKLVVDTTIWADSTQKALGMISGFGVQSGIKEFEEITATAAKLGLNVIDATENYKKLRAVGFSRAEGNELVRLAADMQAGLGLTEETTKRVYLALGQIKGAGKLQGDELRQLQETGLSVDRMWSSIAETMGVTVDEAKALKEEGKVSADVAIKGVKDAVLGTLGTSVAGQAAGKLKSTTLRGLLNGAKGGAQLWLLDLTEEVQPKLGELAKKLGGTFEKFTKDGTLPKFLGNVKRLVLDFIDLVIIRWPEIEAVIGRVIDAAGDDLGSLVMSLDDLLTTVIDTVAFISEHWGGLKTTFLTASAAMVIAMGLIGTAAVIQAGKVAFAFGTTAVKGLAAFGKSLGLTVTASQTAGAAMNLSFAAVAATVASIAAAVASAYAAYDQLVQLLAETEADGGVWETLSGAANGTLGGNPMLDGKPVEPESKPPPRRPAVVNPFGGGMGSLPPALRGGNGPTAFNSTTTINVSGIASPAGVAREVDSVVGRRDKSQRAALYGALTGAPQYG